MREAQCLHRESLTSEFGTAQEEESGGCIRLVESRLLLPEYASLYLLELEATIDFFTINYIANSRLIQPCVKR